MNTLIKTIKKDMSVVHDINSFNTNIAESKKIQLNAENLKYEQNKQR